MTILPGLHSIARWIWKVRALSIHHTTRVMVEPETHWMIRSLSNHFVSASEYKSSHSFVTQGFTSQMLSPRLGDLVESKAIGRIECMWSSRALPSSHTVKPELSPFLLSLAIASIPLLSRIVVMCCQGTGHDGRGQIFMRLL